MPQALADGPLTPNEQRFADLLALEMRAVAEGANPESLRSIAEARRAAGLTCHPVGHDISAVGPSPRRKSRRPGSLHE